MDSFVEVNNIKSEHITNKGIYIDHNKKYLVLRNVDVKFAGDNSKFERNSNKVKKYLKFTISDNEIKEKLIKLSEEINSDNSFYNSDTDLFTVYINNDTNMYDINKNIVKIAFLVVECFFVELFKLKILAKPLFLKITPVKVNILFIVCHLQEDVF